MSGGFSELVKIYIENLNLPKDKKQKLLDSSPKTLADVSLWLEKNRDAADVPKEPKTTINPFSAKIKSDIAKEIQLFSGNNTDDSKLSNFMFNNGDIIDTDDASWGLGIDKSQSPQQVKCYSSHTPSQSTPTRTNFSPLSSEAVSEEKEAQDKAIAGIRENINSSIEIIMQQAEEQGVISSAYNSLKEYFDSQMSLSSVCRVVFAEKAAADLLQRAQDGDLTKEEYWKTKISTAIDMLTAGRELSDEQRTCLEERFAQYTPEELNALIDKIKYTNNEDYTKAASQVDKLIEEGRSLLQSRRPDSSNISLNEKPDSIRALMKSAEGKELMTFNEVYKLERGVDFSPEALKEYDEATARYAMAVTVSNKADRIKNSVSNAMTRLQAFNHPDCTYEQRVEAEMKLEITLLAQLKRLYGDDEEKINEELQNISEGQMSYKDGKVEYTSDQKPSILLDASQKFLDKIEQRKNKMLEGKTVEDYKNDLASSYELAYGRKNATQLARAFENDQEQVVGKIKAGVEYAGFGVMVAGMFICPPAALAGALTASFGGVGVEALNESTRKDGLTKEAKEKIQKELITNTALFAIGGAAGKMGASAKAALLAQKCPTLMACIADIGLDSTISLIGDLALTGQLDIEGEGLSQFILLLRENSVKIRFHVRS